MNRRARVIALAVAVTQLAACARLAPSVPERPARPAESTPTATTPVTPGTAQGGTAQLGVQIFWHDVKADQLRANADRLLNYVTGLGANSVGITFPLYTDGAKPTRVYPKPGNTPTPADIRALIGAGKARGLRVQIRPLLDEANLRAGGAWRGSIEPPDVTGWFTSYSQVLAPFLTAAQEAGADTFVLGSELDSTVAYQEQWRTLVTSAGTLFKGRLSYADNWGAWATGRPGVPGVEAGVDAYPKLGLTDSATVAQITEAWSAWLLRRPDGLSDTVLQEIGIAGTPGAYKKPSSWPRDHQTVAPQIQIRWFAGACAAAKSLKMAGIYFWTLDAWADPANAGGYDVGSFIGRGDQAIKECFASGWPGR